MNKGLVYSTDHGAMCPECGRPAACCCCRDLDRAKIARTDGMVRVQYEKSGRKGKGVTVISGLPLNQAGLEQVSREFKKRFGAGGTVHGGVIEVQGDRRDQITGELKSRGYTVK